MSDTYEVCGFCERFAPSSTMETIYAKDAHGIRTKIRICSRCRSPTLTYIQSAAGLVQVGADVAAILGATLAMILIAVGIIFGLLIGSTAGLLILVTCCLLGAGVLSAEAASRCGC